MSTHSLHSSQAKWRIVLWSLTIGLVFAIPSGVSIESSNSLNGDQGTGAFVPVKSFHFSSALAGFLVGAMTGCVISALRYLPKIGPALVAVFLTGIGGLAGTMIAALFGARTTIVVTGNSVRGEHGAPDEILVVGAILGATLTALAMWGIYRSERLRTL
jgi:hypothetical protein